MSLKASSKKRVLVVDDDPDALKLVEWQLMVHGYDVLLAENGVEGLKKAKDEKPDLILLDSVMPIREMNGVLMNECLKKDPETKQIPVIFFTSMMSDRETVDQDGTVMFPKAISTDRLMKKIKELTSG